MRLNKKGAIEVSITIKTIIIITAAVIFLAGMYYLFRQNLEGGGGFFESLFKFGRIVEVLLHN